MALRPFSGKIEIFRDFQGLPKGPGWGPGWGPVGGQNLRISGSWPGPGQVWPGLARVCPFWLVLAGFGWFWLFWLVLAVFAIFDDFEAIILLKIIFGIIYPLETAFPLLE